MKKFATQVVGEIKLGSLQTFNCPLAYHFYNILSFFVEITSDAPYMP